MKIKGIGEKDAINKTQKDENGAEEEDKQERDNKFAS
jgi:hypothetical protein